jgi:hypothetical protein
MGAMSILPFRDIIGDGPEARGCAGDVALANRVSSLRECALDSSPYRSPTRIGPSIRRAHRANRGPQCESIQNDGAGLRHQAPSAGDDVRQHGKGRLDQQCIMIGGTDLDAGLGVSAAGST